MLNIILIIFSFSNLYSTNFCNQILNKSFTHTYLQKTDSANNIIFKGIDSKIAYTHDRKLQNIDFKLKNLEQESKVVKLISLSLIRGNSEDNLTGVKLKSNRNDVQNQLTLKPGIETKISIYFNPFVSYEGTTYFFKAIISVDNKNYESISTISFFRHEYGDRNQFKNK